MTELFTNLERERRGERGRESEGERRGERGRESEGERVTKERQRQRNKCGMVEQIMYPKLIIQVHVRCTHKNC